MKWLVDGAVAGTTLFFHYSGHGGSIADDDGDESDGKDECLFPVDFKEAGILRDDEVSQILVQNVPDGVKLVAVCDCCHSGTIMDLPYTYKPEGEVGQAGQQAVSYKEGSASKEESAGALGIPGPILVA